MPIRVLITDDHVFYREGVRALLSSVHEIEVVGEANNGDEAIAQTSELKPDVILMDLKMPGMNGIDATRCIHETHPKVGVLVITMFDDDDSVFAAMRAGARVAVTDVSADSAASAQRVHRVPSGVDGTVCLRP